MAAAAAWAVEAGAAEGVMGVSRGATAPHKVACSSAGLAGRSAWRQIPPFPTRSSSSRCAECLPLWLRMHCKACMRLQLSSPPPLWSTTVCGVQIIGVGAAVVGDMSSRPYWGLYELDFVFSILVVRIHAKASLAFDASVRHACVRQLASASCVVVTPSAAQEGFQ